MTANDDIKIDDTIVGDDNRTMFKLTDLGYVRMSWKSGETTKAVGDDLVTQYATCMILKSEMYTLEGLKKIHSAVKAKFSHLLEGSTCYQHQYGVRDVRLTDAEPKLSVVEGLSRFIAPKVVAYVENTNAARDGEPVDPGYIDAATYAPKRENLLRLDTLPEPSTPYMTGKYHTQEEAHAIRAARSDLESPVYVHSHSVTAFNDSSVIRLWRDVEPILNELNDEDLKGVRVYDTAAEAWVPVLTKVRVYYAWDISAVDENEEVYVYDAKLYPNPKRLTNREVLRLLNAHVDVRNTLCIYQTSTDTYALARTVAKRKIYAPDKL